jgi:dTDP-4-amino-4,6-dideoxygalactose transaminase
VLGQVPGITLMPEAPWARSTYWLYTVLVDRTAFGMDSRGLLRHLEAHGIQSRPLWQPLHRSRAHAEAPRRECPMAERLHQDALSLPSSVGMTQKEQNAVIDAVSAAASSPTSR